MRLHTIIQTYVPQNGNSLFLAPSHVQSRSWTNFIRQRFMKWKSCVYYAKVVPNGIH